MDEHETQGPGDEQAPEAAEQEATAEEFDPQELEEDPAYNPDDPDLKRMKGG